MMRRPITLLRKLVAGDRGVAATEFGLMAPVFAVFLLGIYDVAHMMYARALFAGAVERAARNSALETGNTTAADQKVKDAIKPVIPDVTLFTSRVSYYDFADIKRAEKFTDANKNGKCDNNEVYTDENTNNAYDTDIGRQGNGGASDVVQYTVTATYTPVFKVPFMPDSWNARQLKATAIKKNQPYALQQIYSTTKTGNCT